MTTDTIDARQPARPQDAAWPSKTPASAALQHAVEASQKHNEQSRLALLATRDTEAARDARAIDTLHAASPESLPLAGTVLTVKACVDVRGWVTHAGSRVLADQPPAPADAPLVARLRQLGAVVRAQTNMTEFAYGALGLNPWYGTPHTPLTTDRPRVAGGSSSGAAVATALGLGNLAIGSDTSGSVRIPAAWCGVAGFKPSRGRYPAGGCVPLSSQFDVPGLLAPGAAECLRADHALTSRWPAPAQPLVARTGAGSPDAGMRGVTLAVPMQWLENTLQAPVDDWFMRWCRRLEHSGVTLKYDLDLSALVKAGPVAAEAGIIAAQAHAWHAALLGRQLHHYDPRVGPRIALGAAVPADSVHCGLRLLEQLAADFHAATEGIDGVLTPTVPMLPPALDDLLDDDVYTRENRRAFCLTEAANRLDLPSLSLPAGKTESMPLGLMLTGRRGDDAAILALGARLETLWRTPGP